MFKVAEKKSSMGHVKIRRPDGSCFQASTGVSDPKEVQEIGERFQYGFNEAYRLGKKKRNAVHRLAKRLVRESLQEEIEIVAAVDYVREWGNGALVTCSGSTDVQRRTTARHYAEYLVSINQVHMLLEDTTDAIARGFGPYLLTVGHGVAAAQARLQLMATAYEGARHLLPINPFKGIRIKDRVARVEAQRREATIHLPYVYDHVRSFVDRGIRAGCNPEMAVLSLLSLDFGPRGGDLFSLKRSCLLDRATAEFAFYVRKGAKYHNVYLFPPALGLLCEYLDYHLLDQSPDAPLSPTFYVPSGEAVADTEFNGHSASAMMYYDKFLVAMDIRPSLRPEKPMFGKRHYSHASHSGRVSAATSQRAYGFEVAQVQQRLDHSDEEMTKLYVKLNAAGICVDGYEKAGCGDQIPEQVRKLAFVSFEQIASELVRATERLKSLRGRLDLHDGTLPYGAKTWRAQVREPGLQTRAKADKSGG